MQETVTKDIVAAIPSSLPGVATPGRCVVTGLTACDRHLSIEPVDASENAEYRDEHIAVFVDCDTMRCRKNPRTPLRGFE